MPRSQHGPLSITNTQRISDPFANHLGVAHAGAGADADLDLSGREMRDARCEVRRHCLLFDRGRKGEAGGGILKKNLGAEGRLMSSETQFCLAI